MLTMSILLTIIGTRASISAEASSLQPSLSPGLRTDDDAKRPAAFPGIRSLHYQKSSSDVKSPTDGVLSN